MNYLSAMRREMCKLCAQDVSRGEAVEALSRLRHLEKTNPTPEQLTRGALAGGIVGTVARGVGGLVSGDVTKGLGKALQEKGVGGKALGVAKALGRGIHSSGAAAASSATFGAGLPIVRQHLDREAEKDKLRTYLGHEEGGQLRRTSKKYLGV